MNKLLVLLPISLVVLSGCKSNSKSQSATDQSPKETVQLTAGNFNKYVAIHSSSTVNSASNYYIFYTHFIGADNCKFIDCGISYCYKWSMGSQEILDGSSGVASLTYSGDGEATPFAYKLNNGVAVFTVLSVSGTVEVYM